MTEKTPVDEPQISAAMIRAARGLVDLTQTELGSLVGVSRRTISKIEAETDGRPDSRRREVLALIRRCLENEKFVEFIFADGLIEEGVVRRRRPSP